MDATETQLDQAIGDQPVSVEILRDLHDTGALRIDELGLLLGGLSRSGAYRYHESTELRHGQIKTIFRLAKSDAVRDAFIADLLPGTGYTVMKLPAAADLDGDGDVDTNDLLKGTAELIDKASNALGLVVKHGIDANQALDVRGALKQAAQQALTAIAILDYLETHQPKRHRLNGKEVRRG